MDHPRHSRSSDHPRHSQYDDDFDVNRTGVDRAFDAEGAIESNCPGRRRKAPEARFRDTTPEARCRIQLPGRHVEIIVSKFSRKFSMMRVSAHIRGGFRIQAYTPKRPPVAVCHRTNVVPQPKYRVKVRLDGLGGMGVHAVPHARGPVPRRGPRPRAPLGAPAGHGSTSVGVPLEEVCIGGASVPDIRVPFERQIPRVRTHPRPAAFG